MVRFVGEYDMVLIFVRCKVGMVLILGRSKYGMALNLVRR